MYQKLLKLDKKLIKAVIKGKKEAVKELIKTGANVRIKDPYENNTLLHLAAKKGHTHIVQYLIEEKKFNVNLKNNNGDTPIHLAALKGHNKTIDIDKANSYR